MVFLLSPQGCLKNLCGIHAVLHASYHQFQQILVAILMCTSVACAIGPSVNTFSTDFSFQNLVFWNLFEFSVVENHLKIKSPTF